MRAPTASRGGGPEAPGRRLPAVAEVIRWKKNISYQCGCIIKVSMMTLKLIRRKLTHNMFMVQREQLLKIFIELFRKQVYQDFLYHILKDSNIHMIVLKKVMRYTKEKE